MLRRATRVLQPGAQVSWRVIGRTLCDKAKTIQDGVSALKQAMASNPRQMMQLEKAIEGRENGATFGQQLRGGMASQEDERRDKEWLKTLATMLSTEVFKFDHYEDMLNES